MARINAGFSVSLRLAAVLGVLLTALPSQPIRAQTPPPSEIVLRPGDAIQLQVWGRQEFSGEFRVSSAGEIGHPMLRQIKAAGRPVQAVEEDVRRFLLVYDTAPSFVLEAKFRVAVAGEVRQPTVMSVVPGTTVGEILVMTGGITERADLDRVLLRRDGKEYTLDLTDIASEMRQVTLRSGDEVVVKRRRDLLRNYLAPLSSVVSAVYAIARLLNYVN